MNAMLSKLSDVFFEYSITTCLTEITRRHLTFRIPHNLQASTTGEIIHAFATYVRGIYLLLLASALYKSLILKC